MGFTIVRNAGDNWPIHFFRDPKVTKVDISLSCHDTVTGQIECIQPSYELLDDANVDCAIMNKVDSNGKYAVCELIT